MQCNFDVFIFVIICHFTLRIEDLTDAEELRKNPKCDRQVSFYGYVRGSNIKSHCKIHLLGTSRRKCKLL